MQTLTIKNIVIGAGQPKVIVPIVGQTETELFDEIAFIRTQTSPIDVIEWRADKFNQIDDMVNTLVMLSQIRQQLADKVLLFTFRTHHEGGDKVISEEYYYALNRHVIASQQIDLIDIEVFSAKTVASALIALAHQYKVHAIASYHNFHQTPSQTEIVQRLTAMHTLQADILKVAVMPNQLSDLLTLLAATQEAAEHLKRPLITMSMGKLGLLSRICGEIMGSAMTFGVAKNLSAPGQLNLTDLTQLLTIIHRNQ